MMDRHTLWRILVSLLLACVLISCGAPATQVSPVVATAQAAPADAGSSASPQSVLAPQAGVYHIYWFAPLPPMPESPARPFTGSDDFMSLFNPEADWSQVSKRLDVFKLYGEWVAYHASAAELRQVVAEIQRRGLALAVEAGPLEPSAACGLGVEGFAGSEEGLRIAYKIRDAGGTLQVVALDEPYYFAHFYGGSNACGWPAETIARQVGQYIQKIRMVFPEALVGDTEPLTGQATTQDFQEWLEVFRQVNGYDLAFLHLDVNWSRYGWQQEVKSLEDYGRSHGIPVGLIYTGNAIDATDEAWLAMAGERVKRYEIATGGHPDHVLFQSWHDKPDAVLPEDQPGTFTNFIKRYFEDKASLGLSQVGTGGNLALKKVVSFTRSTRGFEAAAAVDGDTSTWWGAGDYAPQWIQIDLGAAYTIGEIRLVTSQSPAGMTIHNVLGKGPNPGDLFALLYTFEGETSDGQNLSYTPPEPWQNIQFIRIETVSSPSWVAWREIAIFTASP